MRTRDSARGKKHRSISNAPETPSISTPPASLSATPTTPPQALSFSSNTSRSAVVAPHGRVIAEGTDVPLANITVSWLASDPSGTRTVKNLLLGTAQTDREGRFAVTLVDNPSVHSVHCSLMYESGPPTHLAFQTGHNARIAVTPEKGSDGTLIQVAADHKRLDNQAWQAVANYMSANRRIMVDDLVSEISSPSLDSPIADWSPAKRSAALAKMQTALALPDPAVRRSGVPRSDQFQMAKPLNEWDHAVNLAALGEGELDKAFNQFRSGTWFEKYGGSLPGELIHEVIYFDKSDLELYRDYLRGVWVTAAQRMHRLNDTSPAPSVANLERQLTYRLHQNFHTHFDTPQPSARLLCELLRDVMLRSDHDGLNIALSSIPAQGTLSDDDYLSLLISNSKLSARELRNRYRVNFERAFGAKTSPLDLNVEALLGLLGDTYQSPDEPFPAEPQVAKGKPFIFGPFVGRAPFFLQYEEWLARQDRFYPENVYDIRRTIPKFDDDFRFGADLEKIKGDNKNTNNDYFADESDRRKSVEWIESVYPFVDALREAMSLADHNEFPKAHEKLDAVSFGTRMALLAYKSGWERDRFDWLYLTGVWDSSDLVSLIDRAKRNVQTPDDLRGFEAWFDPIKPAPVIDENSREMSVARERTLLFFHLLYWYYILLPYLRSSLLLAVSDYAGALRLLGKVTGYEVGVGETMTSPGYRNSLNYPFDRDPLFYEDTTLPYTVAVGFDRFRNQKTLSPIYRRLDDNVHPLPGFGKLALAPFELRFFKLAQGEAMLAWADQLYRNDDPSSIRRARELFKGVLFMHGQDPKIAPQFQSSTYLEILPLGGAPDNPAKVSQVSRARLGFTQIELGLNVYGFREDLVPVLRYKPLKQAADTFAVSAKAAERDFLDYQIRFEQAQIEAWQANAMVKKAQASAGIAAEHVDLAKIGVNKAKEQVAQVQTQIEAKQKEIADADSLFAQFQDYLGGVKDSLRGMLPLASKVMNDDSPATSVTSGQLKDLLWTGLTSSGAATKDAAIATLGSGAGFMTGFGAFVYTSYSSMSAMVDAANKRNADLKALEDGAMKAALAQVGLKERDVKIAQYEQQIAKADLEFAQTLARYQQDRFLNVDLWNRLANFAQRLMRRYIELGARSAWLAERALAYEQNRFINIIAINYFPNATRGLTGPDRLQLDLAELEATRLQGARLAVPVKHTVSLAREFPIQFGQLKKTGRCVFRTDEAQLRSAYPGTYQFRVRAITAGAQDPGGAAPRGVLRNLGISTVSTEQPGNSSPLLRFPDGLALSEFRLLDDLFVYGLPGETLMQFEGSGFESYWEIELPLSANPKGLRSLSDMLITFDMNALYSQSLADQHVPPESTAHALAMAASIWDPVGLTSLRKPSGPAELRFDLKQLMLPAQEKSRKITNIAILAVGKTEKAYKAKLRAAQSATEASFEILEGLALSNADPLQGTKPALPLNAFVGLFVDQQFTLEITKTGVEEELKALFDMVLWIEYAAK